MSGIDPVDAESFRAALRLMKPVRCVRCIAAGEITPDAAEIMAQAHRSLTALQLRTIALVGCLENGWGVVGLDADCDTLVACPDCATADEFANAENEILAAKLLCGHATVN